MRKDHSSDSLVVNGEPEPQSKQKVLENEKASGHEWQRVDKRHNARPFEFTGSRFPEEEIKRAPRAPCMGGPNNWSQKNIFDEEFEEIKRKESMDFGENMTSMLASQDNREMQKIIWENDIFNVRKPHTSFEDREFNFMYPANYAAKEVQPVGHKYIENSNGARPAKIEEEKISRENIFPTLNNHEESKRFQKSCYYFEGVPKKMTTDKAGTLWGIQEQAEERVHELEQYIKKIV